MISSRGSSRAAALFVAVSVLVLLCAVPAFGVTFSSATPSAGSTTTLSPPAVSIFAADTVPLVGTPVMSVDGIPRVATSAFFVTTPGHWEYDPDWDEDYWVGPVYDYKRATVSAVVPSLTDGQHSVVGTLAAGAAPRTFSFTFGVSQPPTLGVVTPAAGTTTTTVTPGITVKASDNSAVTTWLAAVDGVRVPATLEGTSTLRLGNAALTNYVSHTASVTAFDALGNSTSKSWTFTVNAPTTTWSAQTPAPAAVTTTVPRVVRAEAKSSLSILNNTGKMWIDGVAVTNTVLIRPAPSDLTRASVVAYPATDLGDGLHTALAQASVVGNIPITYSWAFTVAVPPVLGSPTPAGGSTVDTRSPAIFIPASDNTTIAAVAATINGVSAPATFDAAAGKVRVGLLAPLDDDSTNFVAVSVFDGVGARKDLTWSFSISVGSPLAGDANNCENCHPGIGYAEDMTPDCERCHVEHEGTTSSYHLRANVSTCKPCHVSSILVEHNRAGFTCQTCHDSTDPNVIAAIASDSSQCASCHKNADHAQFHTTDVTPECAGADCHVGADLTSIHINSGTTLTCNTCHASADANVLGAITGHNRQCTACHSATGHFDAHATTVTESCTGAACHSGTNLTSIHATSGCAGCHQSASGTVQAAIDGHDKSCTACHSANAPHPDEAAAHSASLGEGDISMEMDNSDHGGGLTMTESCVQCHYSDLRTQHANNCALCHSNANAPSQFTGDWNATCQQGGCHVDYHTAGSLDHFGMYAGTSAACSLCHDTSGDFPGPGDNCTRCHEPSLTAAAVGDSLPPITTSDAVNSYTGAATINLSAADVGSAGVSNTFYSLDGHAWSHGTMTFGISAPASGSRAHSLSYYSVDHAKNAETINTVYFTVFARVPDTTPPVTTSSFNPAAGAVFSANQPVTLSAVDNVGGVGVKATYYKIDGGSYTAGTSFTVTEGLHTFTYYSVDNGNVAETPHVSNQFRVDTIAPVTTCDAVDASTYNGSQTFTLSPTDAGSGVVATYWQLDGTGGAWTSGTSVPLAAPASGSEQHTIYWYSRDVATNTEVTKSVTVTVAALVVDTTPPTTTSSFNPAAGAIFNAAQPVTLTAVDNVGGNGVKATYYRIDSGAWVTGTSFSVGGDGLHTFSYYSADNGAVTETVHVSNQFRIDTVAPVTTNSAVSGASYSGGQTFTLAPTDAGSGVSATYWQLDSTSGAWTSGTSVAVAAPGTGSASHTIYWYSQDNATNTEVTKSVTFTVYAPAAAVGDVFLDLYNTEMDVNWADEGGYDYTYDIRNAADVSVSSGSGHSGDTITNVPVGGPYTVYMSFDSENYDTLDFTWTNVSVGLNSTTTLTRDFRDWW